MTVLLVTTLMLVKVEAGTTEVRVEQEVIATVAGKSGCSGSIGLSLIYNYVYEERE